MVFAGASRKYPNVIWFPRSKTDPQEIRETLKLALEIEEAAPETLRKTLQLALRAQDAVPEKFFNDKILGEAMAKGGSISIVGTKANEYIKRYEGKSTGNVSYITNARMLIRLFRFLGFVKRIEKAKYRVTDFGRLYTHFKGEFPSEIDGLREKELLLDSLRDFAFYCVNDDETHRDTKFKIRPFVWLLKSLSIEQQCMYQLIVTTYASRAESDTEIGRIKSILANLRAGTTTLKKEFKKLGLDGDDYSCVHNFYDSAKILVYLGSKLGVIDSTQNPVYGRKITGNAKHIKNANTFYKLTKLGNEYLNNAITKRLIYYSDLEDSIGSALAPQAAFILATLNFCFGNKKITRIKTNYYESIFGKDALKVIPLLEKSIGIKFKIDKDTIEINTPISFNFWQSISPEVSNSVDFNGWYTKFIATFNGIESKKYFSIGVTIIQPQSTSGLDQEFVLDRGRNLVYKIPNLADTEKPGYVRYTDMEGIPGGSDRFAGRISPTDSVHIIDNGVYVDNSLDVLDLLIPLRRQDANLKKFVNENIGLLIANFIKKTDVWEQNQHYTWVRNCFRLLGAEAIYSGSGGMLSRADVSVFLPFVGGIEIKSPRENRGTVATKAVRQAVEAKLQVVEKASENKSVPQIAIAIGRRITQNAINAEKRYYSQQKIPVMLMCDIILYYITLKTVDIQFNKGDILEIFTKYRGNFDRERLRQCMTNILKAHCADITLEKRINAEIDALPLVF